MANRPSHGVQQRILAFIAAKPNRQISKNGTAESCAGWIGKRLDVSERAITAELEIMEREGLVKINRAAPSGLVKQIQVVHGVEPEEWALAEVRATGEEPVRVSLPPDADYRKLADDLLLAALDAMASGGDFQAQRDAYEEKVADLKETVERLRSELSHAKVERDTNIRAKKVAEQAVREAKNSADEARTQAAELESDIADLERQIDALKQQAQNHGMIDGLSADRQAALLKLLEGH